MDGARPATLQTFALVVGAALLGPGLGAVAAALYVALAAVGVPVLAAGAPSRRGDPRLPLDRPPRRLRVAAALAARAAEDHRRRPFDTFFAAAHLIVLGLGAAALAREMGSAKHCSAARRLSSRRRGQEPRRPPWYRAPRPPASPDATTPRRHLPWQGTEVPAEVSRTNASSASSRRWTRSARRVASYGQVAEEAGLCAPRASSARS